MPRASQEKGSEFQNLCFFISTLSQVGEREVCVSFLVHFPLSLRNARSCTEQGRKEVEQSTLLVSKGRGGATRGQKKSARKIFPECRFSIFALRLTKEEVVERERRNFSPTLVWFTAMQFLSFLSKTKTFPSYFHPFLFPQPPINLFALQSRPHFRI